MVLDFSRPGKPTDNAVIESFNGSLRRALVLVVVGCAQESEAWWINYNRLPALVAGGFDVGGVSARGVQQPGNSTFGWACLGMELKDAVRYIGAS